MGAPEDYLMHYTLHENQKQLREWLKIALDGKNSNFQSQIIRLVFSADAGNKAKLFQVYPDEVSVAFSWKSGLIEEDELSDG